MCKTFNPLYWDSVGTEDSLENTSAKHFQSLIKGTPDKFESDMPDYSSSGFLRVKHGRMRNLAKKFFVIIQTAPSGCLHHDL